MTNRIGWLVPLAVAAFSLGVWTQRHYGKRLDAAGERLRDAPKAVERVVHEYAYRDSWPYWPWPYWWGYSTVTWWSVRENPPPASSEASPRETRRVQVAPQVEMDPQVRTAPVAIAPPAAAVTPPPAAVPATRSKRLDAAGVRLSIGD